MNLFKKKRKRLDSKKLKNSFGYAFEGFFSALNTEQNLNIHLFVTIFVIFFGILLDISELEWFICIGWICAVIAAELFNTAIETVVDIAMPYENEKAKLAKDVSAGAVLILAIGAAISGLIIFIPKLLILFSII